MKKIILNRIWPILKINRYNILTISIGALYFSFIIFIQDPMKGDYQTFYKEPFDIFYGINRWFSWSSRLLIESCANLFSKNLIIWHITSIVFGAVLFWSIGRILGNKRLSQSILLLGLFMFTNVYMLSSAGIFATTINYLWPLSCFSFILATIIKPIKNKNLNILSNIITWPMCFFAMCSEQIAILGVLLFFPYIMYLFYNNRPIPKKIILLLIISTLGVVNALICPGNTIRQASEVKTWWPDFSDMGLKSKIIIGSIVTFSRLMFAPESLVILCILSILFLSYKKNNVRAFFSILPAAIFMFLFFWPSNLISTNIGLANYFSELRISALQMSTSSFPDSHTAKIYLILLVCIGLCVTISLFFLYGKTQKSFIMLYSLLSGLAVSMAISLSPTVFASSTRTLYPFIVILIGINFIIIQDIMSNKFGYKEYRINKK